MRLLLSLFLAVSAFALSNKVPVKSTSGGTQTDRVLTIPRYFAQDEICSYPQPYVAGGSAYTYWQADVRNRWPSNVGCAGGSVKFALITVQIPSLPTTGVEIEFRNAANRSSSGNDAATTAAGLTKAQMLAFNGGVWPSRGVYTTGGITHTTSAKTAISNDHYQVLESGPMRMSVLTREGPDAVSAATTRTTSFGWQCTATCTEPYASATWANNASYYSIRPSWVVTFYRTGDGTAQNVETDFILDNAWFDRGQDQRIESAVLYRDDTGTTAGYTAPAVFVMPWRSRMFETVWASNAASYHIDFNYKYLYYSKLIPFDPSLQIGDDAQNNERNSSTAGFISKSDQGATVTNTAGLGTISPHMGAGQYAFYNWQNAQGGGRPDILVFQRWDARWIVKQSPELLEVVLGNAKAALHAPIFYLESSSTATYMLSDATKAFGRVVNHYSRPTFVTSSSSGTSTQDSPTSPAGTVLATTCAAPTCMVVAGASVKYKWNSVLTTNSVNKWDHELAHRSGTFMAAYVATGKTVFLEGMQAEANFVLNYQNPSQSYTYTQFSGYRGTQDDGFVFSYGNPPREGTWGIRTLGWAATFSLDGTVERSYFANRLNNHLEMTRGRLNIDANGRDCVGFDKLTTRDSWKQGRCYIENNVDSNPLHVFQAANYTAATSYCATNANVGYDYANYQHPYIAGVFKHLLDLGWDTTSILKWVSTYSIGIVADSAIPSPLWVLQYYVPGMRPDRTYVQSWSHMASGKVQTMVLEKPITAASTVTRFLGYSYAQGNPAENSLDAGIMGGLWFQLGDEKLKFLNAPSSTIPAVDAIDYTQDRVKLAAHGKADSNTIVFTTQYTGQPDAGSLDSALTNNSRCMYGRDGARDKHCWAYVKVIDADWLELYTDANLTNKIDLLGPQNGKCVNDEIYFGYATGANTFHKCASNAWTGPLAYTSGAGAPSGSCTSGTFYYNTTASLANSSAPLRFYECVGSAWTNRYKGTWWAPTTQFDIHMVCGIGTQACRGQFDTAAVSHVAGEVATRLWRTGFHNRMADNDADGAHGGSYPAMLAVAVDVDASATDSLTGETITARRAYEKYMQLLRWQDVYGSNKTCPGADPKGCDNPGWGQYTPRHRIQNLSVTPTASSLIFTYTAPSADACRIGVSTTPFASTDDSGDTSDGKVVPARQTAVGSLSTGTSYHYRVTCGPGGGTTRATGTATTL